MEMDTLLGVSVAIPERLRRTFTTEPHGGQMTARIGDRERESDDSSSGFGAMALAASHDHSARRGEEESR